MTEQDQIEKHDKPESYANWEIGVSYWYLLRDYGDEDWDEYDG